MRIPSIPVTAGIPPNSNSGCSHPVSSAAGQNAAGQGVLPLVLYVQSHLPAAAAAEAASLAAFSSSSSSAVDPMSLPVASWEERTDGIPWLPMNLSLFDERVSASRLRAVSAAPPLAEEEERGAGGGGGGGAPTTPEDQTTAPVNSDPVGSALRGGGNGGGGGNSAVPADTEQRSSVVEGFEEARAALTRCVVMDTANDHVGTSSQPSSVLSLLSSASTRLSPAASP